MCCRLVKCVPVEHIDQVVPHALGLRLGQLWCNPCMDLLIPGWRSALRPCLSRLAPACERAAALAELAADSMDQADALMDAAGSIRSGQPRSCEWLSNVPRALLALSFGSHTGMLKLLVEAIAITHHPTNFQIQSGSEEGVPPSVEALIAALQHPIVSVSLSAWSTICEHLQGADRGLQTAILDLMTHPEALRSMFCHIAQDTAGQIKPAAGFIISRILTDGSQKIKQGEAAVPLFLQNILQVQLLPYSAREVILGR